MARKVDGRRDKESSRPGLRFEGLSPEEEALARAADAYEAARASTLRARGEAFAAFEAVRRAAEEELCRGLRSYRRGFLWRGWFYGIVIVSKGDVELWRRPAPRTIGLGLSEGRKNGYGPRAKEGEADGLPS